MPRLLHHFGRFGLVSLLCALLNIAILTIGERWGAHYVLLVFLSFALCVVIGYAAHARLSFARAMSPAGFVRYVLAMAMNIPVSLAALWLLRDVAAMPMLVAATLATLATIVYNYLSSRWAITQAGAPSAANRILP